MTKLEAIKRVKHLWNYQDDCVFLDGKYPAEPGQPEWYVVGSSGLPVHYLDTNGHAVCHARCRELEDCL